MTDDSFPTGSNGRKPTDRAPHPKLRKGWTTGACAAAAAAAAYRATLTGEFQDSVTITLPRGQTPTFILATQDHDAVATRAGIIKDAGDDPDVTHGLEIIAEVRDGKPGSGVTFIAGDGVGTVTLNGLALAPGEPAINPGPRTYITTALETVARELDQPGDGPPDIELTITIPGGGEVAAKTMNRRLGIIGGLSVLGTTGVVVPYSCSSWIHSIQRGIDVARAQGYSHVLAATGRTSEKAANSELCLPDEALIDMGDFAGGLLKYVRTHPVDRLTIAGGFAKLTKLAQGAMDLHSSRTQVDFDKLSETLGTVGGDAGQMLAVRNANTAAHAFELAGGHAGAMANLIARQAREVALATLAGGTEVEIWVYDRNGDRIGISS